MNSASGKPSTRHSAVATPAIQNDRRKIAPYSGSNKPRDSFRASTAVRRRRRRRASAGCRRTMIASGASQRDQHQHRGGREEHRCAAVHAGNRSSSVGFHVHMNRSRRLERRIAGRDLRQRSLPRPRASLRHADRDPETSHRVTIPRRAPLHGAHAKSASPRDARRRRRSSSSRPETTRRSASAAAVDLLRACRSVRARPRSSRRSGRTSTALLPDRA